MDFKGKDFTRKEKLCIVLFTRYYITLYINRICLSMEEMALDIDRLTHYTLYFRLETTRQIGQKILEDKGCSARRLIVRTLTHTSHKDSEQSTIKASVTLDGVTWTDSLLR
jgi:hypothetical protein